MYQLFGFVAVATLVVAKWVLNAMSDEEETRTERLREEQEELRRRYAEVSEVVDAELGETGDAEYWASAEADLNASGTGGRAGRESPRRGSRHPEFERRRREDAAKWREQLLQVLRENRGKIGPIAEGLATLYDVVRHEISADSTSPYRRLALQHAWCRIEDAKFRLDAYGEYLDYAECEIQRVTDRRDYAAMLEIEPAEALLPDEWMYAGKLVVASLAELNVALPRFQHKLSFGRDAVRQHALAAQFGDEVPLLVTQRHRTHGTLFYACVARGALYHEHIIAQRPVEMTVTNVKRGIAEIRGTAFDEFVNFTLPFAKLTHKHILPIPGQTIMVYPDAYNITLDRNPMALGPAREWRTIGVSQLPPPQLGSPNQNPVFVSISETLLGEVTDEEFFGQSTQWNLLDSDPANNRYVLGKSSVRVILSIGEDDACVRVDDVTQTSQLQVGTVIPFALTLVTDAIDVRALHWRPTIEAFRQFATQIALNDKRSEIRRAQAGFMRQWQQVLDYQRATESVRSVVFDATPRMVSERLAMLSVGAMQMRDDALDATVLDYYRQVERSDSLRRELCLRIERWDEERSIYIPAVPECHRRTLEFELAEDGSLDITGEFHDEWADAEGRYRFSVQLPSTAIKRQQRALEELFHDRMLQPVLKDILLSPETYAPVRDPFWEARTIRWQGVLSPSQRNAVSTALQAKHLALIQGPPGTGKTTAIVEMLYQLYSANPNCRVLLVSQQNAAVDNALERFLDRYPDLEKTAAQVIRIGNKDKVSDTLADYQFDERYAQFLERITRNAQARAQSAPESLIDVAREWTTLADWMKNTPEREVDRPTLEEFSTMLLADKNLVGATCVGLSTPKGGVDNLAFDVAIIDEAGRATVPELLIPLLRCRKAILIGDHFQLPPCVSPLLREDSAREVLPFLRKAFLETSFFELLFDRLPDAARAILQEQYRMAPEIGDLVGELFYTGKDGRTLFNGCPDSEWKRSSLMPHSLNWVHVKGRQVRPPRSTSLVNREEAEAIVDFLHNVAGRATPNTTVAVITPYAAQKKLILDRLRAQSDASGDSPAIGRLTIKVDTVDGFQGSEADLVCYSTVRTYGALQFLLDRKRLNVACSRAKHHLVFFGDANFLARAKQIGSDRNFFAEILKRSHRSDAGPKRGPERHARASPDGAIMK